MTSKPISALTSMNSVDFGKWKLVIRPSIALKRYPGVMKMAVSPSKGRMIRSSPVALSSRRRLVVPTEIRRPPEARTALFVPRRHDLEELEHLRQPVPRVRL